MLDKQIHLYAVGTSALYTKLELDVHNKMQVLYYERTQLLNSKDCDQSRVKEINREITTLKTQLKKYIKANSTLRILPEEETREKNIISMFESSLSRIMEIETNSLTEDLIILETFFMGVLEDVIKNGFIYKGERYIYFCASAGQIRKKLNIFIKESSYIKHENTFLCGLTKERINQCGGVCVNKFIAYTALLNSATDLLKDFDMRKCVVVEDFETNVMGDVDYIDWDNDCKISRVSKPNSIPHTDGAGIILPRVSKKNIVIRSHFIKGLLTPFDFVDFISEYNGSQIITDIYGKEYDVVEDGIEVIFTKSQFKMWSFYSSWDEYCDNYEKYNCQTGITGEDVDYFKSKTFNYQMLQTLYDMTEDDLEKLVERNNTDIKKIGNDLNTTLRLLGADDSNKQLNMLQKCLRIEPSIANDYHSREILRDKKKQLIKNAKAGKLKLGCKYTYIIPDMFAFAEHLFLGIENPQGLLTSDEVFCNLYANNEDLDVLRSPHLSIEHCLRKNKRSAEIHKWFITDGIYTSVHDLISMLLFFDCDGDIALICNHPIIIKNARRLIEKHSVVPLDFSRKKAISQNISNDTIYDSLMLAYRSGKIGIYSNYITKILNKGTISEQDITTIKVLVAIVNRIIDSAKNQDEVLIPQKYKDILSEVARQSPPYFFRYNKDKGSRKGFKTMPYTESICNKLDSMVKNHRFKFAPEEFGKFDYHILMHDKQTVLSKDGDVDYNTLVSNIITKYLEIQSNIKRGYITNVHSKDYEIYRKLYSDAQNEMMELCEDSWFVTDVLIEYLFGDVKKCRKAVFWQCWGDVVEYNLKKNKDMQNHSQCIRCNTHYVKKSNRQKYCDDCRDVVKREKWANKHYDKIGNKSVECKRCGGVFNIIATSRRKICDKCKIEMENTGKK